jgi:hypothetical protein
MYFLQDRGWWNSTRLFFDICTSVPGGLLAWAGAYLTQFFYYPALGSAMLIALWLVTFWLAKYAFRIADEGYPQMHYKLTYQIGFGLRYDYSSGWAWSLAFDFSQVTAAGRFLLSSDNGVGIPGSRQYVACDIFGLEKRILIDFSVSKSLPLTNLLDLEMAAGIGVNNTKVSENAMVIAGRTYSILDVWNGQDPYAGIGSYPYINQGAIGFGGLASVALCYSIQGARADLGYQLRYMQTNYRGYNDNDSFALQHIIFLRFNINNFKF